MQVPCISGGAEIHAQLLKENLVRRGHEADIITIPFKWYPEETLLDSLRMAALVDLTQVNGEPIDQVIALKFPMYALRHPRKTVWLLHQHRQAYDLWGTPYGDLHTMAAGESVRQQIMAFDAKVMTLIAVDDFAPEELTRNATTTRKDAPVKRPAKKKAKRKSRGSATKRPASSD